MEGSMDLTTKEGKFGAEWIRFQARWRDRDDRMELMSRVVRGDWTTVAPDDKDLETRSPNLVQVALEDTAEAASLVPSVRVGPSGPDPEQHDSADYMERQAVGYLDASEFELLTVQSFMNLAGYGISCWVVTHTPEGGPRIEWRDPRTCYPEPNYSTLSATRRCYFARELYLSQLPQDYQDKFQEHWSSSQTSTALTADQTLTLVEYYDAEKTIVAGVYASTNHLGVQSQAVTTTGRHRTSTWVTVFFEEVPNEVGHCPVFISQRLSLDPEPRGQFDQVVGVLQAHIRLMSLVLDYADQAVYSDVWVKDLIGAMSYGGGSYIQLGPQGDIGRVPPAVTSMSVYNELDQLLNNVHLGARWPKVRPGEVDQAIASAKFVEATAGIMNTAIRTYHQINKRTLQAALRYCFAVDKKNGVKRTISGVHKNQQFVLNCDPELIDLQAQVRVEYGLGLGRDPAQSAVLGIQFSQAGLVSKEFVQENFEGITDVALERIRVDTQQLRDMAFARLLQGLEAGEIPPRALVEIAKARMNGEEIFALFDKFVVEPQEEAAEQTMTSGLNGETMTPGPDPNAGQGPPPPPDFAGLLGGLAGGGPGGPPPAPPGQQGPESIGRLSVPAGGPGSFAGTTTQG